MDEFSVLTVFVVPLRVTVLVPFVKTEDAPLVSQLPETVTEAEVNVMVPLLPPVIVTSVNVRVDEEASRSPPFGTLRFAPPEIALPLVVSVPLTLRVWLTSMAVVCEIVPLVVRS